MKLVIAVVQDEDANGLLDKLTDRNIGVTKLATTGGFLKSGNTTLMIGIEKEKCDEVIKIIEEECKTRKQVVSSPSPATGAAGVFVPYPLEVNVGGATIFVVDVDKFHKV